MTNPRIIVLLASLAAASPVVRAATIPTDVESAPAMLDRLYSYFGGVASFQLVSSSQHVFSGASMALTINFQPSAFGTAGVAIGTLGVSAPNLAVSPSADTFSITIQGPSSGTMKFYVLIREDDNQDGLIDLALGDDEWSSPELTIPAGATTTFNIPSSTFTDTGNGSGNGIQNFTDSTRLGLVVDLHSKTSYPGGIITSPRTLYLDHIGFYQGSQIAPPVCTGDINLDGAINTLDLTSMLGNFGLTVPSGTGGDLTGDGIVNTADLTLLLGRFGQSC